VTRVSAAAAPTGTTASSATAATNPPVLRITAPSSPSPRSCPYGKQIRDVSHSSSWPCPLRLLSLMDSTGNWLTNAWTALFAIYCVAVLPLLGWAIAHAG
jgi:hypothetical protein